MDEQTIIGGYVDGRTFDIDTINANEVTRIDTALNPENNLYTVRFYGRDGELLREQQLPVGWTETAETTDTANNNNAIGLQHLEIDGDGLNLYGDDGELLWRADHNRMYVQGVSSAEYHTALNMRDLWQIPVYDADTCISDNEDRYGNPYVRRYTEDEMREQAEEYPRITYGTRTEQTEYFQRIRSRYLDAMFLNVESHVPTEEQPDIEDERGGALDEFLDGFKPQETKPKRSDEQE